MNTIATEVHNRPSSQLARELEKSRCTADSVLELVRQLAERLRPHLRDEDPPADPAKQTIEYLVPSAAYVRDTTAILHEAGCRIQDILERLEA